MKHKCVQMKTIIAACVFCGIVLSIDGYVLFQQSDYIIEVPYCYPVVPGTEEWASFTSRQDMVDICQIPENVLSRLSTEALVKTVLTYPLMPDMYLFYADPNLGDSETGFWHIANSFNGLSELMQREDALCALEDYGISKDISSNRNAQNIIYRNISVYQQALKRDELGPDN